MSIQKVSVLIMYCMGQMHFIYIFSEKKLSGVIYIECLKALKFVCLLYVICVLILVSQLAISAKKKPGVRKTLACMNKC
jgi:hypothetical protein